MLFGMGTVLTFLTVLVLAITLMSWVLRRYFPVADTRSGAAPSGSASLAPATDIDASVVAAITAAIHRHRAKHPRR